MMAQQAVMLVRQSEDDIEAIADLTPMLPEWKPRRYVIDDIVQYDDGAYKCVQAHDATGNPDWTPRNAASLWFSYRGAIDEWPRWAQPAGAHDAYAKGARVTHNSRRWTSDVDANVWEPGIAMWTLVG